MPLINLWPFSNCRENGHFAAWSLLQQVRRSGLAIYALSNVRGGYRNVALGAEVAGQDGAGSVEDDVPHPVGRAVDGEVGLAVPVVVARDGQVAGLAPVLLAVARTAGEDGVPVTGR